MQHALELLAQAQRLLSPIGHAPTQADLRRSVSASYYAVFHMLVEAAAGCVSPSAPSAVRFRIMRAFGHREMRSACTELGRITGRSVPRMYEGLLTGPLHPDLAFVAETFVELQIARHAADYDLEAPLARFEAQALFDTAERCVAVWPTVQALPETITFLTALLLADRWTRRG